jgi:hypothetical protein
VWVPVLSLADGDRSLCQTGDECSDLPRTPVDPSSQHRVAILDARTFATMSERTYPKQVRPPVVDGLGQDFTGDGISDLTVSLYEEQVEEHWSYWTLGEIETISGDDGVRAWSRTFPPDAFASVVEGFGPVGGEPGDDLLIVTYECSDDDCWTDFERVDGADGTTLVTSRIDAWTASWLDDATGDGVRDLGITEYPETEDEGGGQTFRIESGADGSTTYLSEPFDWATELSAFADLDGDGLLDVLGITHDWHRRSTMVTFEAITPLTGDSLWSQSTTLADEHGYLQAIEDVDGGGAADLAIEWLYDESTWYEDTTFLTRIELRGGEHGANAWSVGDVFPIPPENGAGMITGRVVTAEGEPVEGMCVRPHPAAGWETYASSTDANGSFVLDELDAGSYDIEITDCGPGLYRSEWFSDASNQQDATPVLLADAEPRTIGDITVTALPGPVNDEIDDAIEAPTVPFYDQRSTAGAVQSEDEPLDCWYERTIWYRFAPEEVTELRASVPGDYGTAISWFEQVDGQLELVDHCGETTNGERSWNDLLAEAGHVYYLRVATSEYDPGGVIDLTIEEHPKARISGRVTDESGNPLEGIWVWIAFDEQFAIQQLETDADGRYRSWELPADSYFVYFEDPRNRVFRPEWFDDASDFADATLVPATDGLPAVGIDATLAASGPPTNDRAEDAESIPLPAIRQADTRGATTEAFEAFTATCFDLNRKTVWYRVAPSSAGTLRIDTAGSGFSTALGVYAVAPGGLTNVACAWRADAEAGLEVPVVPGVEYFIQAGGYLGASGDLMLSASLQGEAAATLRRIDDRGISRKGTSNLGAMAT